jgi:hypothetical protein
MKNINVSLFAILLCAFLRFLEQGDENVRAFNPFIYTFMDSQFRDDTKAMFKRLCPCP